MFKWGRPFMKLIHEGKIYNVHFTHHRYDRKVLRNKDGKVIGTYMEYFSNQEKRVIPRSITYCQVVNSEGKVFTNSYTFCSWDDNFSRRDGRKESFQKILITLGMSELSSEAFSFVSSFGSKETETKLFDMDKKDIEYVENKPKIELSKTPKV